MNLREYLGKNINIIDDEGNKHKGFVEGFTTSEDDDMGQNILVRYDNSLNIFYESDIKEIKIIN